MACAGPRPPAGSCDIDTNLGPEYDLCLFLARDGARTSFLRPARDLIGSEYVLYGPRCVLVVSFAEGTQIYTLNRNTACFDLTMTSTALPDSAEEIATTAWPCRTSILSPCAETPH